MPSYCAQIEKRGIINKRDKFISEPRLLDSANRGVLVSEYDSFDSLIDNPYIPYVPQKHQVPPSESSNNPSSHYTKEDFRMSPQGTEEISIGVLGDDRVKHPSQMSYNEQGSDYPVETDNNGRLEPLMEPLLENNEDGEEEEPASAATVSANKYAPTCTNMPTSEVSESDDLSIYNITDPEELLNKAMSPTREDINRCLVSELKSIKAVPNL